MTLDWKPILDEAAAIVESYDIPITLRQLFYRLVAKGLIENLRRRYTYLSEQTARGRRDGTFPALIDRTRSIYRPLTWDSTGDALDWMARNYRRDRTEGQNVALYLGCEKDGQVALLDAWFGDLGIPILALGGYTSQSHIDEVVADLQRQGRPAVMLYVGDYDATGMHIPEKFRELTGWPGEFIQLALTPDQIDAYVPDEGIVANTKNDPRRKWFVANHGEENRRRWGIENPQVEMDALDPDVLHGLLEDAMERYLYRPVFEDVMQREAGERARLIRLADEWQDDE
jgi:hypothetical protein